MNRVEIGLLLVDDHPILREGLTSLINSQPDMRVLAETGCAAQALEALGRLSPDVVLLDLCLPGNSGTDLGRTMQKIRPAAKIVILSNSQGCDDIARSLEAGALAYLFKTSARQDILSAVRSASAGRKFLPPDVAMRLAQQMPRPELSKREMTVLQLMAEGLRNKEIAGSLKIAEPTAKEHVRNIFAKLQVNDRTAAVMAALRRGILHLPN